MPDIQLPQIQEVTPAQTGAGQLSMGAATAPAAALQGVGAGIQDVGQFLGKVAMDRQAHINQGILANEETIRQNTYADVQRFMAKNQGSPETWQAYAKDKWQEYTDGKQARMQEQGWGPSVQFEDKQATNRFQARANIEFENAQSKAFIGQANARLMVQARQFMSAGDEQSARTMIGRMDLNEGERDQTMMQIVKWGQMQNASNAVEADPFTASTLLTQKDKNGNYVNFGSMLPADRQVMAFRADRMANFVRSEQQRSWMQQAEMALNGQADPLDRTTVDSIAQHQGISPKFVNALFTAPKQDDSPEAYAGVISAIHSYDPTNPDPAQEWQITKQMQGLNPIAKERAEALFKSKLTPDSPLNNEGMKFGVSSINDAFEKGIYGKWRTAQPDENGEHINQQVYQQAMTEKANALTQLNEYIQANPKATPSDIQKQLGIIHRTSVARNGASLMLNDPTLLPVSKTTQQDAANLQSLFKKYGIKTQ